MSLSPLYFDYNATTPCDPRVLELMNPFFYQDFGNPASLLHNQGWRAQIATEKARGQIAKLIGAQAKEVFFTSGATESNNWTLLGILRTLRSQAPQEPVHFLASTLEHASILMSLKGLKSYENLEYDLVEVDAEGFLNLEDFQKKIKPHTKLFSMMLVNNEIGTIQDMKAISEICRSKKIYLHSDATQAVGKIPLDVNELGLDLVSCSAHKFYGPKGVGILYVRSRDPHIELAPLLFGGGHERGLRSGTLNVASIVGLGAAAEFAGMEMAENAQKISKLRQLILEKLAAKQVEFKINGPSLQSQKRAANNLNLCFKSPIESKLHMLSALSFSAGSACQSENKTLSHVLKAIGLNEDQIRCSMRLSLGQWSNELGVNDACDLLAAAFGSKI